MWAADVASQHLGIRLEEVKVGYARASMHVVSTMVNGHDICHGGYVFSLADTAFAFACNSDGMRTVAAACHIVFVGPARRGDELTAEARERVRFGRSGIYDVTVRRQDSTVVAELRGHSRLTGGSFLPSSETETS